MASLPPPLFTEENRQRLAAAASMGVKEVTYGDKKTVYQDLSEMLQLLALMDAQLYGTSSLADRRTQGVFKSTIYHRNCYE